MITFIQFRNFVDSQSMVDMSSLSHSEKDDKVKLVIPQDNEDSIDYWQFLKIGDALIFEKELMNVDNESYFQIVKTIHSHLGGDVKRIISFDNPRWAEVLSACKAHSNQASVPA